MSGGYLMVPRGGVYVEWSFAEQEWINHPLTVLGVWRGRALCAMRQDGRFLQRAGYQPFGEDDPGLNYYQGEMVELPLSSVRVDL